MNELNIQNNTEADEMYTLIT